jgi:PAS domain S-box-containing protein
LPKDNSNKSYIHEKNKFEQKSSNTKEIESNIDESDMKYDFYNLTPAGYFILDRNGIVLNVNSKGSELLGTQKRDIIKNEFIKFIVPEFQEQYCNICDKAIITGLIQQREFKLIKKNGKYYWAQIEIMFKPSDNKFKMSIIDINERKEVEIALLENERKFRISLETLLDAFAIFSPIRENDIIVDFKFEYINEVGCILNQKTYGEQVGYSLLEIFPELKSSPLFNEYVKVIETGNSLLSESLIYKNVSGERKLSRALDIRAVKLGDGFALAWRDVTERKKAEKMLRKSLEEKEILLREIHHRIKNNMQVISSLLGLQSMYVKDKNSINILKESQERVKSMAIVHEKLYGSKDFTKINLKEYIKDLSMHLFNSFDAYNINLKVEGEDLFLDLDTAIPCGLIINELITNSIKYAFPAAYGRGPADLQSASPENEIRRFEYRNREKRSFRDIEIRDFDRF